MVRYHIFVVSSTPKIIKYNCTYSTAVNWIKLLKQRYPLQKFQIVSSAILEKLLGVKDVV